VYRSGRLDVLRYALYDAGNSNYDTLVVSLGFAVFLGKVVVRSSGRADLAWGAMFAAATLLAAIIGPRAGALADRRGSKFHLLRLTTLVAGAGTLAFALLPERRIGPAAVLFVATQTSFLLAVMFYNSALADVSTRRNAATISSLAWGAGYAGGIIGLGLALSMRSVSSETLRLRLMFLLAGGLFLVFALPLLLMRRGGSPFRAGGAGTPTPGIADVVRAFASDPARLRFFWAYFLYTNGVNTVILFTARFAQTTLHFGMDELIRLFIVMNVVAGPAAVLLGRLAERTGQLRMLRMVVIGWVVAVAGVCVLGARRDKVAFAVVACCAASLVGPVQALSRSLFRVAFPDEAMTSFFAVQALAARSAALVGPLLFGFVSWLSGSQVAGAASAEILFVLGLVMLMRVPRSIERTD